MKNMSFKVEPKDLQRFKRYCKKKGSNPSVELRRFVKLYNDFHHKKRKEDSINHDFFSNFILD